MKYLEAERIRNQVPFSIIVGNDWSLKGLASNNFCVVQPPCIRRDCVDYKINAHVVFMQANFSMGNVLVWDTDLEHLRNLKNVSSLYNPKIELISFIEDSQFEYLSKIFDDEILGVMKAYVNWKKQEHNSNSLLKNEIVSLLEEMGEDESINAREQIEKYKQFKLE